MRPVQTVRVRSSSSIGRLLLLAILLSPAQRAKAQSAIVEGFIKDAASGKPVENARVLVVDAGQTALARSDGTYRIRISAGSFILRVTRLGYAPATGAIEVTAGQNSKLDFSLMRSAALIDPIVSVGTRSRDRTATSSAAPVDVISSETIGTAGLPETWEVIQRSIPSANVTRVPLLDDQIRAISLRGLSPDHVLVLVNGKRRHNTAIVQQGPVMNGTSPVDINGIPSSAIERIEVLRDGAAAQYGSDAIAGVVNVILKSGEQSEATASFGSNYSSEGGRDFRDGQYRSLALSRGRTFQNGSAIFATAQYRDRGRTNRAYPDPRPQYFPGDPRNQNPPRISAVLGDAQASDLGIQLVGNYPLTAAIELYATSGASRRDGLSTPPNFRPARSDNTVRALYPDGYLPEIATRIFDYSTVVGGRGMLQGWHWDLSSSAGSNSFRYSVDKTNNVSLGTASATGFYAGMLRFRQWTSNLDVSRKVVVGPSIPLTVAAGTELRRDFYRISAGEPDSWRDGGVPILDGPDAGRFAPVGAQGFIGFRPSDEISPSRTDLAGYVDVEGTFLPTLLIGLAGRTERYSDFGSRNNARLSMRFEPFTGVAFRGTVGTGFRAPSLIESYFSTTSVTRIPGVSQDAPLTVRTLPVASPEAQLLGARPLRPEESVNVSAGIVVTIPRLPVVTVDYYAINLNDRIVLSGDFLDSTVAKLFLDHGLTGIAGGQYFTNAIDTRTRGIDIVATHGFLTGKSGTLQLTGAYNRTETKIVHVASMPADLRAYQSSLFGRTDSAAIEVDRPRSDLTLSTAWSAKRFTFEVHNQRFGRVSFVHVANSALDQTLTPKWITDASSSYRLTQKLRLLVAISNAFDVYPDDWKDFNKGVNGRLSFGGTIRYPAGFSPFGVSGRRVSIKLSYR